MNVCAKVFSKALLGYLLVHSSAFAQSPAAELVGNPHAGKYVWETLATSSCKNCHGIQGQGGFAPTLAGRGLTPEFFVNAIRNPLLMPDFPQFTDQNLADFAAHFARMPPVAEPGAWRHPMPADAAPGLRIAYAIGCPQCHGPMVETPRHNAGAVGADFEWFKSHVYDHTNVVREHWSELNLPNPPPFIRMGNYTPERLPESVLEQIFNWMQDVGFLTPLTGGLSERANAAGGGVYTLTLINRGLPGKGLVAQDVRIAMMLPAGAEVVETSGAGYEGIEHDAEADADAATWLVPEIRPTDQLTYQVTLTKPGTVADNVRASIHWTGAKEPEELSLTVGRRPRSFP
jgi:cytochrome c553